MRGPTAAGQRTKVRQIVEEEAGPLRLLLHATDHNTAVYYISFRVVVRRVHDGNIHKGGLITHAPHRNVDGEMALHAMAGAQLDEFARTGKAPVGRNAPSTAKPRKKAKKKRPRQSGLEETQRATKKQRRSKRDGRSTRKSKRGRIKR